MSRIALLISYDGSNYHGWQKQSIGITSIQGVVEHAISKVADCSITVVAAGRTDAKVHACYQVVHFDYMFKPRPLKAWIYGVNRYLPAEIRVLAAKYIIETFDARRSAISRTYNYFIYNHPIRSSLFNNYIAWEYNYLDVGLMEQASQFWIGEHDFNSFRAKDCQSHSSYREVYAISCTKQGKIIKIAITANAFLKHMVRNMVGSLIKINNNKDLYLAKEILLAKDRSYAGATAAPQGLYLVNVAYPIEFKIAADFVSQELAILPFFHNN